MFQGILLVSEELFCTNYKRGFSYDKVAVNISFPTVFDIFWEKFARIIELEEKNRYFSEQLHRLPLALMSEKIHGKIWSRPTNYTVYMMSRPSVEHVFTERNYK